MPKRLLIIAVVGVLAMSLTVPAGAGPGGTDRPFKASLAGFATFELPTATCPAFVRTHYTMEGTASHMGRVDGSGTHCPLQSGHSDGHVTITAANGDQIFIEYEDPGTPSFGYTVTGGTGRFVGASGSGLLSFTVVQILIPGCNPVPSPAVCFDLTKPWPGTGTFVGTISY